MLKSFIILDDNSFEVTKQHKNRAPTWRGRKRQGSPHLAAWVLPDITGSNHPTADHYFKKPWAIWRRAVLGYCQSVLSGSHVYGSFVGLLDITRKPQKSLKKSIPKTATSQRSSPFQTSNLAQKKPPRSSFCWKLDRQGLPVDFTCLHLTSRAFGRSRNLQHGLQCKRRTWRLSAGTSVRRRWFQGNPPMTHKEGKHHRGVQGFWKTALQPVDGDHQLRER